MGEIHTELTEDELAALNRRAKRKGISLRALLRQTLADAAQEQARREPAPATADDSIPTE